MNTRRNNARRAKEENVNIVVAPLASQNPQVHIEEGVMTNVAIRETINIMTQVLSLKFIGILGCK